MNRRSRPVRYYPVFFNIQGKKCVVVGGGEVGLRKVRALLECGGRVTVISPKPRPEVTQLANRGKIRLVLRDYKPGDLRGAVISIAATDVKEINRRVAEEARKTGVPVNVADDPEPSDFIIPSSFRRGSLTVAVSTAGESPALARRIRRELEESLGKEYAPLVSLVGEVRFAIKEKGHSVTVEAWQKALDLDLLAGLVRRGQRKKAKEFLLRKLISDSPH